MTNRRRLPDEIRPEIFDQVRAYARAGKSTRGRQRALDTISRLLDELEDVVHDDGRGAGHREAGQGMVSEDEAARAVAAAYEAGRYER